MVFKIIAQIFLFAWTIVGGVSVWGTGTNCKRSYYSWTRAYENGPVWVTGESVYVCVCCPHSLPSPFHSHLVCVRRPFARLHTRPCRPHPHHPHTPPPVVVSLLLCPGNITVIFSIFLTILCFLTYITVCTCECECECEAEEEHEQEMEQEMEQEVKKGLEQEQEQEMEQEMKNELEQEQQQKQEV
eukprot:GHVU01010789.1.p2 GENE.GHVU01010789.1~~GHVU01010789.1.p2  ORF type:complete len:186 (-),score=15.09 GHVU01010789.1:873-1430(-)